MSKKAVITLEISADIVDEKENPNGSRTAPMRVYTNYKYVIRDFVYEKARGRKVEDFDLFLGEYVKFCVAEMAGIPFQPLTTEEALKIPNCRIVEEGEGV